MTAATTEARPRASLLEGIALTGSTIVLLGALAAFGHVVVGGFVPPPVIAKASVAAHLATVLAALPLAIIQLALPKGTGLHRIIGYTWCALMVVTALITFSVKELIPGKLSPIHFTSAATLIGVPLLIYFARTGKVASHRATVLTIVITGFVIAGLFAFLPGRGMGRMFWTMLPHASAASR